MTREFEALNIPQIKKGIFSIWLHYINPELFPIVNNSHNNFRDWIELPNEYSDSIEAWHEIKDILKEKDFGNVDFFAYHFTPEGGLSYRRYLNIKGKSLYKVSHGNFAKHGKFTALNFADTLEKNNWISISSYTGKNQGSAFEKDLVIGDIVYVCYGGDTLSCIGEVMSEAKLFPEDIAKSIGDDEEQEWLYREIRPLFWPVVKDISDLKGNRSQTMPSGNSTLWQIKPSDLEMLNNELFIPKYNLEISNEEGSAFLTANPQNITISKMALNTIMYGPPGTGKTYNTIEKAIALANPTYSFPKSGDKIKDREEVKKEFDRLKKLGQVYFTTFHQSLSYEDFIEGIKPLSPQPGEPLKYDIIPGLFKQACAMAAHNCYNAYVKSNKSNTTYTFDDLYDAFIAHVESLMASGTPPVYKTIQGRDVEIKEINSNDSIIARAKDSIAKRSAPLTKENIQKLYDTFDSIDEINDLDQVRQAVQITPRITEFYAVFGGLKAFEKTFVPNPEYIKESSESENIDIEQIQKKFDEGVYNDAMIAYGNKAQPVVFVIDEINRGNVSQIFGELITLIEDDKRAGRPEALEAKLPYSKKSFSVPANLYIVGTMNTADRSVEALDTALRRRFAFEEKMPEPKLLIENVSGIALHSLLTKINERIELLLDRDHTIGHSYFINVKDEVELKLAFKNKILPLLQEYFYGDYGKVGLVLGGGFVAENKPKNTAFAKFNYPGNEQFIQAKYELLPIDDNFKIIEAVKTLLNEATA